MSKEIIRRTPLPKNPVRKVPKRVPEPTLPELEEEMFEEEQEVLSNDVTLTTIVTGTAPAIKLPSGEVLSTEEYLVWLGNKILSIERALA